MWEPCDAWSREFWGLSAETENFSQCWSFILKTRKRRAKAGTCRGERRAEKEGAGSRVQSSGFFILALSTKCGASLGLDSCIWSLFCLWLSCCCFGCLLPCCLPVGRGFGGGVNKTNRHNPHCKWNKCYTFHIALLNVREYEGIRKWCFLLPWWGWEASRGKTTGLRDSVSVLISFFQCVTLRGSTPPLCHATPIVGQFQSLFLMDSLEWGQHFVGCLCICSFLSGTDTWSGHMECINLKIWLHKQKNICIGRIFKIITHFSYSCLFIETR